MAAGRELQFAALVEPFGLEALDEDARVRDGFDEGEHRLCNVVDAVLRATQPKQFAAAEAENGHGKPRPG